MHVCVHNMYIFLHTLIEEHRMFPCAYIYMGMYTLYTFLWMMSKHVVIPRTSEPIVGRACPHFTTSWTCILLAAPPSSHPSALHVPKLYGLPDLPTCWPCMLQFYGWLRLVVVDPHHKKAIMKIFGCMWVWVWIGDITPVESMLKVEVSLWSQLI